MKTNIKRFVKPFIAAVLSAASAVCLWTAFAAKAEADDRAFECYSWCNKQFSESVDTCDRHNDRQTSVWSRCYEEAKDEKNRCMKERCGQ